MAKLWEKTYSLNALMEAFTVGEDPVLDARLVNADCVASMAHAAMLATIGILSKAEHEALHAELARIVEDNARGSFAIARSDEDVHTAIENRLVGALGDAGKKLHTGRSRNDQVLVALRLWTRGFFFAFHAAGLALVRRLLDFSQAHAKTPMPGRTHLQTAMPSSVGLWAAAFAEELLDDLSLSHHAFTLADCCAAGLSGKLRSPASARSRDGGGPARVLPCSEQRSLRKQQPGQARVDRARSCRAHRSHPLADGTGPDPVLPAGVRVLHFARRAVLGFQHHAAEAATRTGWSLFEPAVPRSPPRSSR